ncbi:DUF6010 family protein [Adhaeribacter aquaticus]|uniref:DUF6010 family protein n=1 Tax=Adhaeribacter aquaticus TaxID=299567 RepID=UPI000479DD82|nr:DUF6010 family protein [Adhaeribacter aquaticus]
MNNFYIGLITTIVIIGLLEVLRFLEKRLIGALTLVGIAFIYIGFSWKDIPSLIFSIIGVAVFLLLAYFGYKNNFTLIIIGLLLHGLWDLTFPLFSSIVPEGYDIFCLTIDFILAFYFYLRVESQKPQRVDL